VTEPETHLVNFRDESPTRSGNPNPRYHSDELDHRVMEAVRRSEEVIKKSSPVKGANKNLDPYIQKYLRNDYKNTDPNLLYQISPFLTSDSKYTTTLTIEQPNYGRESQPINFNAHPREEVSESTKKSGYVDIAPTLHGQQPNYTNQGTVGGQAGAGYEHHAGTYGQGNGGYSQSGTSFGQPGQKNYGETTAQYDQGRYGQPTTSYEHGGATYGQTGTQYYAGGATNNLGHSGTNQAYGNYGTTNYGETSQKNYASEADDLTKRIAERLNQSRTVFQ